MNTAELNDEQFKLLFNVRRSIRYHDRRRAFFDLLHQVTSVMTILMAGSVLFEVARPGDNPVWMILLSIIAALFAAVDMAVGFARRGNEHKMLRSRFADLEIAMLLSDLADPDWKDHKKERLCIEKDEPPVYVVLDLLCHNELLVAMGYDKKEDAIHFVAISDWKALTSQLWRWENHLLT